MEEDRLKRKRFIQETKTNFMDLGQWCELSRQAEGQEVAVHNIKLRIVLPHFTSELGCNLGSIQKI